MSRCSQCDATFVCGVADGARVSSAVECWCMILPRMPSIASAVRDENGNAKTCLCPDCLRALRSTQRIA